MKQEARFARRPLRRPRTREPLCWMQQSLAIRLHCLRSSVQRPGAFGVDGIVYQKDLGEKTIDAAGALTEYNPGNGWSPAI